MGGTGVLAIDNFVEIFGIATIGWFQDYGSQTRDRICFRYVLGRLPHRLARAPSLRGYAPDKSC